MSVSGFCFLFWLCLRIVSRCFFVFVFFCLFSCFVLNHNIIFFVLHLVFFLLLLLLFFCFCCFGVLLLLGFWLPIKKHFKCLEIPKTPKMKNAENILKKHFDKSS